MEVGASCHGGIQLPWLPPRRDCLPGGICKKLLRGIAMGAWDTWLLLLRSSRTTNAGLLLLFSWSSGYCTWGVVGTARSQTKLMFNLCIEILEWVYIKQMNCIYHSVHRYECCQNISQEREEKPENLLTQLCLSHLGLLFSSPQSMQDRRTYILNNLIFAVIFCFFLMF
jgi:hypothetical protein